MSQVQPVLVVLTCDWTDMVEPSRFDPRQKVAHARHQWPEHVDVVAVRDEDDDGNREFGRVLLVFHVAVDRQQHVELFRSLSQKCAVPGSAPPGLNHCTHMVIGQLTPKLSGKQHAHGE